MSNFTEMPNNIEAERTILGAIVLDSALLASVAATLKPDDFYSGKHQVIYRVMLAMANADTAIDLITLPHQLAAGNHLEVCGGAEYLASLIDGVPRITNVDHWSRIVGDAAKHRRAIHIGDKIATAVRQSRDGSEAVEAARREMEQLSDDESSPLLRTVRGCDVQPQESRWLWAPWFPHGLVMLDGDPGTNKSGFVDWAAAKVTTGGFPGQESRSPADALIFSNGEDPDSVHVERVQRSGGNVARVHLVTAGHSGRLPHLPRDTRAIIQTALHYNAPFIALDGLYSFVAPGTNIYDEMELRAALQPFGAALAEAGLVCVAIRHFTKMRQNPMQQGQGAVAGAAVARSVLMMTPDGKDADRTRLLSSAKLNSGARPTGSLRFRVEADGPMGTAWLLFDGESSVTTNEAVKAGREDSKRPNKLDALVAELEEALKAGPLPVSPRPDTHSMGGELSVTDIFRRHGYAEKSDSGTGRKVRKLLGIESGRLKGVPTTVWVWFKTEHADRVDSEPLRSAA